MIFCAARSYPQRPILLRMMPQTRPPTDIRLLLEEPDLSAKNQDTPAVSHIICQDKLQIPARTLPMRFTRRGDIQVALSSKQVLTVRAIPTWKELKPTDKRKVTIWPEKLSTVKYRSASENDGKKAGCR